MPSIHEALAKQARENLEALRDNPYSGRGMFWGRTPTHLTFVYWLMGRGSDSRNRVLVVDPSGDSIRTAVADPSKLTGKGDQSLLIYQLMCRNKNVYAISNGEQTAAALDVLNAGSLDAALANYGPEPDSHRTARITAVGIRGGYGALSVRMSILSRSPFNPDRASCRAEYVYDGSVMPSGYGYYISTYNGDSSGQLPPFEGPPRLIPIWVGPIDEIANFHWETLNPDNRVALAVEQIDLETGAPRIYVKNKYPQVA